jgi:hypothetical protein
MMKKMLLASFLLLSAVTISAQHDSLQVHIGDYYYSDGTVSSVRIEDKYCVGMVFSLHTSVTERAHGWTHGQIVALEDALTTGKEWGRKDHLCFPYTRRMTFAECRNDNEGYLNSHSDNFWGTRDDAFFTASSYFSTFLPEGKTSGWYLPSIGQWCEIIENIAHAKVDEKGFFDDKLKVQGNLRMYLKIRPEIYWSSSQRNEGSAWSVSFGGGNINCYGKFYTNYVRAVAAF